MSDDLEVYGYANTPIPASLHLSLIVMTIVLTTLAYWLHHWRYVSPLEVPCFHCDAKESGTTNAGFIKCMKGTGPGSTFCNAIEIFRQQIATIEKEIGRIVKAVSSIIDSVKAAVEKVVSSMDSVRRQIATVLSNIEIPKLPEISLNSIPNCGIRIPIINRDIDPCAAVRTALQFSIRTIMTGLQAVFSTINKALRIIVQALTLFVEKIIGLISLVFQQLLGPFREIGERVGEVFSSAKDVWNKVVGINLRDLFKYYLTMALRLIAPFGMAAINVLMIVGLVVGLYFIGSLYGLMRLVSDFTGLSSVSYGES